MVNPSASPVLLMAVVEWSDDEEEESGSGCGGEECDEEQCCCSRGSSTSQRRIHKLRVTSRDVSRPPSVTLGDLESLLRRPPPQSGEGGGKDDPNGEDGEAASDLSPTFSPCSCACSANRSLSSTPLLDEEASSLTIRVLRPGISLDAEVDDVLTDREEDLVARYGGGSSRHSLRPILRLSVTTRRRTGIHLQRQHRRPLLAIQGRHFADSIVAVDSDDEENRIISINVAGRAALRLHQRINDRDAATAGSVWDGALFMVKFLERHALEWLHNRTVLELGSGVGLVGIAAGVLGARRVILTDLHPNLDLLQRNIRENECHWKTTGGGGGGGSVSGCERMVCRECDWNCPPGRLSTSESDDGDGERADVILVADCVWVDPLVEPLLSTVVAFATTTRTKTHHREDVRVLFSYQRRGKSTDELFWTGLRRRFASVDILDDENLGQPVSLQLISCRHPAL